MHLFACALLRLSKGVITIQCPNIAEVKLNIDGLSGQDFIFHRYIPPKCPVILCHPISIEKEECLEDDETTM